MEPFTSALMMEPPKLSLLALIDDGPIEVDLLKKVAKDCLIKLKNWHSRGERNIHPEHIFYNNIGHNFEIEFKKSEDNQQTDNLSELKWMAPEIHLEKFPSTVAQDIFKLGLVFFYLFTEGKSVMQITTKFFKSNPKHEARIDLKPLDLLRSDTECILFIDLIKSMVQEEPNYRVTSESLIEHALFKENEERLQIVQELAEKCFDKDQCIYEYLVEIMNQNEKHMKGSLVEDSAEWKKLFAKTAKFPDLKLHIKVCSNLVKLISKQNKDADREGFDAFCLQSLPLIMAALPNFFPHVYHINRGELPLEDQPFEKIFRHDINSVLGTGSTGTIVYKGKLGDREIAIRRVAKIFSNTIGKEIAVMLLNNNHPNILRYYAREVDADYFFIGMELCEGNLATFIADKTLKQKISPKQILQQSAEGLHYLHRSTLIHRNIKPENILIFKDNLSYSIKLGDFGIGKDLYASSVLTAQHLSETPCWIAPEVFLGTNGHTNSSDIFSLGCVFFLVIFDETILSEELGKDYQNIEATLITEFEKTVKKSMSPGNNDQLMQIDLMTKMLKLDPNRPSIQEILQHPLFWEPNKSISFINAIRRKFDIMNLEPLRKMKNYYHETLKHMQTKFNLLDLEFGDKYHRILQEIQTEISVIDAKFENKIRGDHEMIMKKIEEKLNIFDESFVEINIIDYPNIIQDVRNQLDNFGAIDVNKLTADQEEILKDIKNQLKSINGNPLQEILDLINSLGTSVVGTLTITQQDIMKNIKKKLRSLEAKPTKLFKQHSRKNEIDDMIDLLDPKFLDDITKKHQEVLKEIQQKFELLNKTFKDYITNNHPQFVFDTRKRFEILDSDFPREYQYQISIQDLTVVKKLKDALDIKKSVVDSDWKAKLDKALADEFKKSYDKETVSDLLKAFRDKWAHMEELNDKIKNMLGNTASRYLDYYTIRFPALMIHCYDAVSTNAKEDFKDYFYQEPDDDSEGKLDGNLDGKPVASHNTNGVCLRAFELNISCNRGTTFPHAKVLFNTLVLRNISHMFVEGKKSFTNFLQRNGSTVTEVVFASGSLKFESLTEILQNIESLQKIEFDAIKYEVSNTNQTIDQATCQNLVELVIRNPETPDGKLLKEAFKECQTIKTVKTPDSDMKVSKEVVQDEQVKLQDEKLNSFLIKKILQKDPENQDTSENLMDPEAEKKALPNFLTHLNNIYREELPKVEDRQFGEIFEHFNDKANSLRTGLQGSRVYKGKFQRRPIAIKRVIKDLKNIFDRDVSIMLQIDQHSSIFKYFSKEITEYIIYFGTELCEGNLATFIKDHSLRTKITAKTIFRQTAEGLMHLHQFNIIHRDVKPENILICYENGTYNVKLADFCISKASETNACIAPEVDKKKHTKSSDVFSLGGVFYFVISNGTFLSKKLGQNYVNITKSLEEKLQALNIQGNIEPILQMDLLIRMLNFQPELRPSAQKVLHHPLFWADKRCFKFILEICKKIDVLDPKLAREIKNGMEHEKVLDEKPILKQLKVALDLDKSVVYDDWISKLDPMLAEEFKSGYDKESVSDLLKAIRNKWIHKEELKNTIEALFGDGNKSDFFNYFTSRFPRILIHCYNAVEKEAKNLLAEYFYLNAEELAVKSVKDTPGLKLEGSKLIIRCQDVLTFPEINIECDILKLFDISHIFIEHNESFSIFLQRNASNVTQLEFFSGSLKFDSVNKILQKLSSLKKIQFCNDVEYETSKEVLTTACEKLLKLEVYSADSSNLLQAFQKFQTIQKLSVKNPKVALQEILQKYANIVELEVVVHDNYPVSHQYETNSNQLKVLKIKLCTKNEKIQEELFTFVQSQHNLQQFFFHCINNSLSQSICKRLATYICQLEHLSSLLIYDRKLLEEVEAFVANYPTENTRLKELKCGLIYLKLPSSFFGYFTNLTTLDIHCSKAKLIKVEDLFSFMKNTQLTSITLRELSLASFQLFKSLHVETLEVLDIKIHNEPQDKVFDVLLEFLPRHPRITQFRINLLSNYDDLKSPELISMIVGTLKILEKLEIVNCPKITVEILKQITTLKSLKSWQINDYKSETFYET